jgi:uncharacterized protein (TIGR03000 family)
MTRRNLFLATLALGVPLLLPSAAPAQLMGTVRSGFGFRGGVGFVPILTPFGSYPLFGPGYYGYGPSYYSPYAGYYNRAPITINYYNPPPAYSQPDATTPAQPAPSGPQPSIQEFRNGKAVTPAPAAPTQEKTTSPTDKPARIEISLPADADLWFDGTKTRQTGSARQFVTPPLATGQEYSYEVMATWKDKGQAVTETRRVTVRAGDRTTVSFAKTSASTEPETLGSPKKAKP